VASRIIYWARPDSILEIRPGDTPPEHLGAKAIGLLWLPSDWVPPFFVLDQEFHRLHSASAPAGRKALLRGWLPLFEEIVRLSGLEAADIFYLRSNAVTETIAERGKYRSLTSTRSDWIERLGEFFEAADAVDDRTPIALVVQRYVRPLISGHLSNERRVAEEYRDGIVEFVDAASGDMREEPVSFRRWRKSKGASLDALLCARSDDLLPILREPLAYATAASARVLYEWIWDGAVVYIVQADRAPDKSVGLSPEAVVPGAPTPGVSDRPNGEETPSLRVFRVAGEEDGQRSSKIRSHFMYAANGFPQPPLYVVNAPDVLAGVLTGSVNADLLSDLNILTQSPLVIRTSIAGGGATLLPRSDVLQSADAAAIWLTGPFAAEINRREIAATDISLIAHHFVPALGAAFSTGAPDKREVYIEALWGIPEGLYYYPCDAYLVDTLTLEGDRITTELKSRFAVLEDIRFKGQFVSPDSNGQFVVSPTARPWDWKAVIADAKVAKEIAAFTRKLAVAEGKRIKLMWFLGCHPWTGPLGVLPWYHDFEADDWTSTERTYRPNSRDETLPLRTLVDLEDLERKAAAGYQPSSARQLVVQLNPAEDRIIRDEAVAQKVGAAAASLSAVVELQGGILSHVYYSLRRAGANVSVRRPPSFALRPAVFQKLVRDRIPEVVAAGGEFAKISHLTPAELSTALKIKLVEEAFEARDAASAELLGELADVLEVLDALLGTSGFSWEDLEEARSRKHARRGGFKEGVVLIETSLVADGGRSDEFTPLLPEMPEAMPRVVQSNAQIHLEQARPGPFDMRTGSDFIELIQSSTVGLTHPEWHLTSPQRVRLDPSIAASSMEWTLEGQRHGSQLRLRLRVRLGTRQLSLPLDDET